MLQEKLQQNAPYVSVSSAGLGALVDHPAHELMRSLLQERGLDLSKHVGRQMDQSMVLGSDLILTMTTLQKSRVHHQFPQVQGRVYRIGHWDGFDVPDPINRPGHVFEQCVTLIEQSITSWIEKFYS